MRILFTIAHFFNPDGPGKHASQRKDPRPRLQALGGCITTLHQLYGSQQRVLNIAQREAQPANHQPPRAIDVVICTTGGFHLLDHLPLEVNSYRHHPTQAEPLLLGFECQAVLRDALGQYDYYCFLEDDLILHDPDFFLKLRWFTQQVGDESLLQANRFELAPRGPVYKLYIDGDIRPGATAEFQNVQEQSVLTGHVLGQPIQLMRALNPHSGCYFLNQAQMEIWVKQPHFLDRDIRFIGPLESAATLGVMKTFRIYKPAPENASFLEIQHYGMGFLNLLGKEVKLSV